jgi:hypothetical protein
MEEGNKECANNTRNKGNWPLRPEDWLGIKLVKPGIHHLRNVPMGIHSIWK